MLNFEDYARRARLDLSAYFAANDIKSDDELLAYCQKNGIGVPSEKYFENKKEEVSKPAPKVKKTEKKVLKKTKETEVEEKTPAPKKKQTRTTRTTRTRTKKAPAKK